MVDLPPTKFWDLSLPSQCRRLLHVIENLSFLVEDNRETINELYETLNVRKKLQSVLRKENGIILEPTGKNSDLKKKYQNLTYITCQMTKGEKSHGQEELV